MFFWNSRQTHRYPASRIERIGPYSRNGEPVARMCTVYMIDGEEVVAYESDIEMLNAGTRAVIPASPGYSVVHCGIDSNGRYIIRSPIIAWYAMADGELRPATVEGFWDGCDAGAIEQPDGRVFDALDETVYDEVDVLIDAKQAEKERRAGEAQRRADEEASPTATTPL